MSFKSIGIKSLLLAAIALVLSTNVNASIIYNVDRIVGGSSVTGFIETDGTLGVLDSVNILDWELTLTTNAVTDFISKTEVGSITNLGTSGNTSATSTQMLFNFDLADGFFLLRGAALNGWCLEVGPCTGLGYGESISHSGGNGQNSTLSGAVVFAETSAVPIPAAAWLFGSGLIGLISVARRKA